MPALARIALLNKPAAKPFGRQLRMVGRIASGGMGAVYRASCGETSAPIALKVLHKHVSAEQADTLAIEAEALRRIQSPHVVRLLGEGATSKGTRYLAMEFIAGPTLAEVMKQELMPLLRGLEIARQVLDGLAAAHRAGVVHGDVKPHNIILEHAGTSRERAVIVDFGLARLFDGAVPAANAQPREGEGGATYGSADYLAPERILGCPASAGADLYGVGVILYRLVTGELPFDGTDATNVMWRHLNDVVELPSERIPFRSIPAELDIAIVKSLDKKACLRFASAADFAEVLAILGRRLAPRAPRRAPARERSIRRRARVSTH